jgi:phospholipase/lecithinase/hemolysin
VIAAAVKRDALGTPASRKLGLFDAMFSHFRYVAACVLTACSLATHALAQAAPKFDHLVVLGDSLSDMGNAGRFSNGPVWVEQLATRLNVTLKPSATGGLNFAVGGARLDPRSGPHSLRAQADQFLRGRQPAGRTLHIIYGGGNDLLAAVGDLRSSRMVEAAVASLRSIVLDLLRGGATDLLLPNMPDVGMTPRISVRGARAMQEALTLTDHFNTASDDALSEVAPADSGRVRLYRLNVRALAERARSDPAAFGLVNVTSPCSGLPHCRGYLFWDDVHPTTHAHGRLADSALQVLSDTDRMR